LVGLLAVLIIGGPGRIDRQKQWQRIVTGIVIAFITVANLFSRLPAAGLLDATAFSPTDISAVKRWAKLLMPVEACLSLGIVGLVISRAINILK
jgi:hypothetical protein